MGGLRLIYFLFFFFDETHPFVQNLHQGFERRLDDKVQDKSENIDFRGFNRKPPAHADNGQGEKIKQGTDKTSFFVDDDQFPHGFPVFNAEKAD